MQKIIPHLWFDHQAESAAQFYVGLFKNARLGHTTHYTAAGFEIHGQTAGSVMTIEFELAGQQFIGLNAGPIFKFTPAISFLVACESPAEVEALWAKLSEGGKALMELDEYPFSAKYGWVEDKYGLSWQLMDMGGRPITQKIVPTLMYVGAVCGRAEEAITLYTSIFKDSKIGDIMRYDAAAAPDKPGTITHAGFTLAGQDFAAMDSAREHGFTFTEAISLLVPCETQAEIDYYWEKLSAGGDPAAQQCGWLKDKFGVSWQISPTILVDLLRDADTARVERVTTAFLQMKKFDIEKLKRA